MEVRTPLGPKPESPVSLKNDSPGPKSPALLSSEDGFDLVESANQVNLEEKHLSPLHSELGKIGFFTSGKEAKRTALKTQIQKTKGHLDAVSKTADKISAVTKKPVPQETLDSLYKMHTEQPEDYKTIDNSWSKALADATKTEVPVAQKASFETAKAELETARSKLSDAINNDNSEKDRFRNLLFLNKELRLKKSNFHTEAKQLEKDYQAKIDTWLKEKRVSRAEIESVDRFVDEPDFLSPSEQTAKTEAKTQENKKLLNTYFDVHPRDLEYEALKLNTPETYKPLPDSVTESKRASDHAAWNARKQKLEKKENELTILAKNTQNKDKDLVDYIRRHPKEHPEVIAFKEALGKVMDLENQLLRPTVS